MNYDDFFKEAIRLNLRPPLNSFQVTYHSSLDNEALFQLPLLAMVILTLSKGKRKPKFAELGQLVGDHLPEFSVEQFVCFLFSADQERQVENAERGLDADEWR